MRTLYAPETLRAQLEAIGSKKASKQGTFLFRRGDTVSGIYLISAGTVRLGLEREAPAFPSRNLACGAVIGLPATLSDSTYSLSAQVVEDAELIFIPRERLIALLRDMPSLCFETMTILTQELVETRAALERVRKAAN